MQFMLWIDGDNVDVGHRWAQLKQDGGQHSYMSTDIPPHIPEIKYINFTWIQQKTIINISSHQNGK